jgi:sugar phosphate isomerase/epimerase
MTDLDDENSMLTADTWPIAAAMLPFASADPDGADPSPRWSDDLGEVRDAGFEHVDLTDSWVRYGELAPEHVRTLVETLHASGLQAVSMSAIRRSVIDEQHGDRHLAYAHRCIDVAAQLGVGVVSFGLHRALTPEQARRQWFWTAPGHRDPLDDPDALALAVTRFRELGDHAAELGMLLSLELYEHTFLGTAESAVRLVEQIDRPHVGLNPDVGNLVRLHEPVEHWRTILELTLPWANFWHVKNYARDENPETGLYSAVPSYLESGIIDYRTALKLALDNGFQGVLCTEHYGGDGLSMSAANREYLRNRILPKRPRPLGASRVRQQYPGGAR